MSLLKDTEQPNLLDIANNFTGGAVLLHPQINNTLSNLYIHHTDTVRHSGRVAQIALFVAQEMGLSNEKVDLTVKAGFLHDIGKLEVPTTILEKDGKPTDEEWELIKQHPSTAFRTLESIHPDVAAISGGHHMFQRSPYAYPGAERVAPWINDARRAVAVSDQVDALMSKRGYKDPWSPEKTRAVLQGDGFFSPGLIDAAVSVRSRMNQVQVFPPPLLH